MKNLVYEKYSQNQEFRFQVWQRDNKIFEIIIEHRYYEWYYLGDGDEGYYDFDEPCYATEKNMLHFADTLEKAIAIGNEELASHTL